MTPESAQPIKVADVMSSDVEFVAADATVKEAAILMGEIEVGALPVGSATDLEGIVTDRDILYRVVARGRDPSNVLVCEILSRPVMTCREEDTLQSAMDAMAANHVRRMPVEREQGRIVGWITLADISRKLLLDSGSLQQSLQAMTEAKG